MVFRARRVAWVHHWRNARSAFNRRQLHCVYKSHSNGAWCDFSLLLLVSSVSLFAVHKQIIDYIIVICFVQHLGLISLRDIVSFLFDIFIAFIRRTNSLASDENRVENSLFELNAGNYWRSACKQRILWLLILTTLTPDEWIRSVKLSTSFHSKNVLHWSDAIKNNVLKFSESVQRKVQHFLEIYRQALTKTPHDIFFSPL